MSAKVGEEDKGPGYGTDNGSRITSCGSLPVRACEEPGHTAGGERVKLCLYLQPLTSAGITAQLHLSTSGIRFS